MKLCLIYICWSDWDLLSHAVRNMRKLVDGIIIIGSTYSNYHEYSPIPDEFKTDELYLREPHFHIPLHSETDKRNYGLQKARELGYTHFLMSDADEMYDPEQFLKAKERFLNEPNLFGFVCPCEVFFKSPTLTIGRDITLVPFIHKLTKELRHEFNRKYQHAWINGQIRIDPSRSLNINSGVEYTEDVTMFHYSWVRKDYEKKIRNSSARANLERSSIREDYANAKPGYFCKFYRKTLIEVPNLFNLPV